jgi:hypothetical protein
MDTLQIRGLVIECDFLIGTIKIERYMNDEARDARKEDFTHFGACLGHLKTAFETWLLKRTLAEPENSGQ